MAQHGWQCIYIPDVVAHHHPSSADDRTLRGMQEKRNMFWVAWLRRPLTRAAMMTLSAATRTLTDREFRRALPAALRGMPWVLRERRAVSPEIERNLRTLGY